MSTGTLSLHPGIAWRNDISEIVANCSFAHMSVVVNGHSKHLSKGVFAVTSFRQGTLSAAALRWCLDKAEGNPISSVSFTYSFYTFHEIGQAPS